MMCSCSLKHSSVITKLFPLCKVSSACISKQPTVVYGLLLNKVNLRYFLFISCWSLESNSSFNTACCRYNSMRVCVGDSAVNSPPPPTHTHFYLPFLKAAKVACVSCPYKLIPVCKQERQSNWFLRDSESVTSLNELQKESHGKEYDWSFPFNSNMSFDRHCLGYNSFIIKTRSSGNKNIQVWVGK